MPRFLRREAGAEVDRLYRRHADEVLRYTLLVLRSRTDAEDVTQTVFLRALRAIERGERVRTPRNWLIKIAHNECRRLLANRKVHTELPDEIAVEPVERGRAEELRAAMAALPETQRQALVLRELEGRSYAEIAATLAVSVSAVETLIFRARRALREQIENAMTCEEFAGLLDDPSARARVRAHARVCPECATLDHRSRGRKSALKRIASALGLPWWGAKLAAVAVTTATVAAVAIPHDGTRPAVPAEPQLNLIPPRSQPNPVPPTGRTRFTSPAPKYSTERPVAAAPTVSDTAPASGAAAAPRPAAVTPAPPLPDPPKPGEPPLPPRAGAPATPAEVQVPTVTIPPGTLPLVAAVPALTLPALTLPALTVPVVPDPPAVTVPAELPKVSLP